MAAQEFDFFVIGGGSGGVRAARIAAQHGAKVGIAESYRFGGTCVIRGCVPKKLFVYAGRFRDEFEEAQGFGWSLNATPSFDWPTLIANKDREIARLENAYRSNLEKAGVTIFEGHARFKDANTLHIDGRDGDIRAAKSLIATGGTPNLDHRVPGIEHVITSNEAFHLETFPKRIVIAGGGYIACEFAGIFAGLGADVTQIYRGPEILRGFDDEVRTHVREAMEARGVRFAFNQVFTKIEKTGDGLVGHTTAGEALVGDQIMFAIGRSPNVDGLGLDGLGVEQGANGKIVVDATSRTSVDSIYAVGDVTDRVNLTPVAIREGHALADMLFSSGKGDVDHDLIPTAVFTTPEIGTVGLTEQDARERYRVLDIYRSTFRPMKSTLGGGTEKMLLKLLVDGESDRVVGCHIVGPDAGEMAQLLGIALKMGATKADFDRTMALHPTAAEELVTMRQVSEQVVRDAVE
ncbi:MAG: glutathione-disulfide reductase [Pseudomonadota bacterium]